MAANGWEYVRAETLPCEERSGLTGRTTVYHNVLVFRRPLEAAEAARPAAPVPGTLPPGTAPRPLPRRARQAWLLPTVGTAAQMRSLLTVFGPLGEALAAISRDGGVDVLVDLGRLGAAGAAVQLWAHADSVLVFTDSTLSALNTLAVGLPAVADALDPLHADSYGTGVLIADAEARLVLEAKWEAALQAGDSPGI